MILLVNLIFDSFDSTSPSILVVVYRYLMVRYSFTHITEFDSKMTQNSDCGPCYYC
jgi:hypothetical protein